MTVKAQFPSEQSSSGAFSRQQDAFNERISAAPGAPYPAASGRYHLYVSLACPWAHRTVIVRELFGLDAAIGMTAVDPIRTDGEGWAFREGRGYSRDPVNGFAFLREAYDANDPAYCGRVTVPVLWDRQTKRIVSNNDDTIMRSLETEFGAFARRHLDLYPIQHRTEIDELNERVFETVNDGVYRAGFATTQGAYEASVYRLFETLDMLEGRLATRRYLFGPQPVETDWRLFVTLVRFDAVYVGHFKCNVRRIADYPSLSGYLRDLYQKPGVASTVDFDHIKRHYYATHGDINPTGIVPVGPLQDLAAPHGRQGLSSPARG